MAAVLKNTAAFLTENMEKNGEYFRAIGYYQEAYDRAAIKTENKVVE